MTEDKLNTIEEALAHQDQQIQDLSEMVIVQTREIDVLRKRLQKLENKISAAEEDNGQGDKSMSATEHAAMTRPPHY